MENKRFRRCILLFILILAVGMAANIIPHNDMSFPMSTKQKDIEELVLRQATQVEIAGAGGHQGLKRLYIYGAAEDLDLSPVGNLTELEELSLNTYGREIDTEPLGELTQLGYLSMEGSWNDLSFVSGLSGLREIMVQRSEVKDLSIFADLTRLRKLYIEYVEDIDLKYLENLTALEELHLCGGHIRNMEYIKNLKNLKELYLYESMDIYDNQPEAETIFLSGLKELETLTIVHMNIGDLGAISEITSLSWIALGCTGITDIMPLRKLENLKFIGIYGNESEAVKEQAGQYFKNVDGLDVDVSEGLPVTL